MKTIYCSFKKSRANFAVFFGALFLLGLFYSERAFSSTYDKPIVVAGAFVFNPRAHTWTAISDNGRIIRSGRASGGRSYCPDIHRSCRTPTGVFRISHKGGAGCRSSRYPVGEGGAPMPYCMFFSQYYAVHGSYDVPNYNASHGCIRVRPSDARWLHANFMDIGTKVIVRPY